MLSKSHRNFIHFGTARLVLDNLLTTRCDNLNRSQNRFGFYSKISTRNFLVQLARKINENPLVTYFEVNWIDAALLCGTGKLFLASLI